MATQPTDFLSGLGGIGALPNPYQETTQVQANDQALAAGQQRLQLGAQQLEQAAAQQAQDAQYQADVQTALQTGKFASLYAKYPDKQKALQASHDALDEPTRQANERDLYAISSFIKNGNVDAAKKTLQNRIKADTDAGQDVSDDQQMFDLLNSGDPKQVASAADLALYGVLPPDKRDALFSKGDKKFTNTPQGDIYDTTTGEVTHAAGPKPDVDTQYVFDENGNKVGTRRVTHPAVGQVSGETIQQLALAAVPGATVTSGARSPEHNAAVGGASNSYHLTDQARDLVPPAGMTMAAFHNVLQQSLPGMKVLNEGDHIHVQPLARNPHSTGFMSKPAGAAAPQDASSLLDAGTISMMAEQYLAGDTTVMQNLGRGKQGSENIVRLRSAISQKAKALGLSGGDVAAKLADFKGTLAAERTAGTRIANVELAATEAQNLIPLALQASQALPRSGFLPFSKAQQSIRNGTNDPKLRAFVAANNALVNVYSRAVSPSGTPTVSDKEHARELLDTAYDQTSYASVVTQMQREISAARAAPRQVRADLRGQISGGGDPTAVAGKASIPAGAKPIGTYQGKPVYQLPNGKRWTP